MNKALLQTKLQSICDKQVGLELYFLYRQKDDDPIQILRANLDSSVQDRLEKTFVTKIKYQFLNLNDSNELTNDALEWTLKHIDEVDDLKNVYYYFQNNEKEEIQIPDEFKEMPKLINRNYEDVDLYEFGKHALDDVFAFLIRLRIDNEQIILFKHKYSIDVLSRSIILKAFGLELNHETRFKLESEPLLKLTDKIDFMFVENDFIILNLQLLESKYGYNERYLKKGAEALSIIKSKNILLDYKILDTLSIKVSFSKKLMKVKADNEVLKTSISDMKSFLDDFKTKDGKYNLAKRIKYLPKENKFDVRSKIAAEDFLRLLNDQYLISQLTKKPYISESQTVFELKEGKSKTKTKNNEKVGQLG